MKEMPRVMVALGIPTHRCATCGKMLEWAGREAPTVEMLSFCPNCDGGPLVPMTREEQDAAMAAKR